MGTIALGENRRDFFYIRILLFFEKDIICYEKMNTICLCEHGHYMFVKSEMLFLYLTWTLYILCENGHIMSMQKRKHYNNDVNIDTIYIYMLVELNYIFYVKVDTVFLSVDIIP